MRISIPASSQPLHPSLARAVQWEIIFPTLLLILGIYHGLLQTLYRAGIIRSNSFLGLEYYQGLTLHGVVNAIVFTTFFAVALGNILVAYYLKKTPNVKGVWVSFWLMFFGTLITSAAILSGKASVLYTFYPPLKATPSFYIGAVLLVIGSWVAFFNWIPCYLSWRKENPALKTPLGVLGILATFIVWMIATLPLAYEVLVLLLPWSMGWTSGVNVMLARVLFWFFGHPLVYFWLLPAYSMYYVMLPKLAGGKLYSDAAGRMGFLLFIVFSAPVGLHHQFSEPGISSHWKALHTLFTFGVSIPSFITAFTLAASLEYAARSKGGRGYFRWWSKLPYFDEKNYLFAYFFVGLLLFLFGGITGIINASYTMNSLVHNTSWIPGHFHTTVGGPVFLSFIGMGLYLIANLSGKKVRFPKLNLAVPYLWLIGIALFSVALSISGLEGEPRRTNMGLTYTDPQSALYNSNWHFHAIITAIGGSIMFLGMLFYFIVFFGTLCSKKSSAEEINFELPTSEALHDENIPMIRNLKPWILAAIAAVMVAYVPPLIQVSRAPALSPTFTPDNPVPNSK